MHDSLSEGGVYYGRALALIGVIMVLATAIHFI